MAKPFDPAQFTVRDVELEELRKRVKNLRRHHTYTPTHLVSTVDLLVEHWEGMWAETMVFELSGPDIEDKLGPSREQERYTTFEDALADHPRLVKQYGGAVRVRDWLGGNVVVDVAAADTEKK